MLVKIIIIIKTVQISHLFSIPLVLMTKKHNIATSYSEIEKINKIIKIWNDLGIYTYRRGKKLHFKNYY